MSAATNIATAWVLPPKPIGGQDHVGVQAPCVALYTQLLPGITNVTDRARYYSFHPWVLRHFDKRYPDQRTSIDAFARVIRRAECLLALISIRHSRASVDQDPARHDAALVGRQELQKVDQPVVDLEDFAAFEGPHRYFKNRLGGLGQYYYGPLRDLRVLGTTGEGRGTVPGYDATRGATLAAALDEGVDADRFFSILEAPTVSTADLEALAAFCPCHLAENATEREGLRDLFLARSALYGADGGSRRRATLGLVLELMEQGCGRHPGLSFEDAFRVVSYTGALPDGATWRSPPSLAAAHRGWATYQRNELFSVAVQALFAAVLTAVVRDRRGALGTSAEAGPIAAALCEGLGPDLLAAPLSTVVAQLAVELPRLDEWRDERHELQQGWRCVSAFAEQQPEELAAAAVRVLLALAARGLAEYPYSDVELDPEYFDPRELHLLSFKQHLQGRWATMSVAEWVSWLAVRWGIERHLRVALQKLRGQRQDTFRVRPLERSLQVVEAPEPAFTVPRIGTSLRILRDIGLIDVLDGGYELTAAGKSALESIRG